MRLRYQTFAIDFDATIVTDGVFPKIGELKPHAKRVMDKIVSHGGQIAIWTCRSGERELEVKDWLIDHQIPFDTLNEPFPQNVTYFGNGGRKILADCYIDDKGIYALMNGSIDWLQIEEFIFLD